MSLLGVTTKFETKATCENVLPSTVMSKKVLSLSDITRFSVLHFTHAIFYICYIADKNFVFKTDSVFIIVYRCKDYLVIREHVWS